tara:strand:+ start:140 stop:1408 length:1269 start_codon:yes stop_codon:yes gene_type:complete
LYYEFFNHNNLNRIDVRMTESEWDDFIDNLERNIDSKEYFHADTSITTVSGTYDISDVGFRIRGNTTRAIPQRGFGFEVAHFKIKFDETFNMEEDSLAYLERNERRFANLRAVNLKSPTISEDRSHTRELYAYDLFNQVGVYAPLTGTTRLYLHIGDQTIDYGIYTMVEPVDKSFLRKRYGDDGNEGNLYKCLWQWGGPATLEKFNINDGNVIGLEDDEGFKPTYDLKTNKDEEDHTAIVNFVNQINDLSGDDLKAYLDANFEIQDFLRALAMNVLIGMPDDYWGMGNNYYLYFANNDKIRFIPYDYDHSFGEGWQPFDIANADIYEWWDDIVSRPRPLAEKVMAIDAYREQYTAYVDQFTSPVVGNFHFDGFNQRYQVIKDLIDPDGNDRAPGDPGDLDPTISNEVSDYFSRKIRSARDQL